MACMPTKTLLGGKRLAIALCGDQDSGKTSTLLELAAMCKKNKFSVLASKASADGKDEMFVFDDSGLIIGIGTAGDSKAEIDENFNIFDSYKCDIVFVPTRNSGSSWRQFMARCAAGGYGYKWVSKDKIVCSCWQPMVNTQVAKMLLGWLQK